MTGRYYSGMTGRDRTGMTGRHPREGPAIRHHDARGALRLDHRVGAKAYIANTRYKLTSERSKAGEWQDLGLTGSSAAWRPGATAGSRANTDHDSYSPVPG